MPKAITKTDHPYKKCEELGVLDWKAFPGKPDDLHPRVSYKKLMTVLSMAQLITFDQWYHGSTLDELGIYAWDVERFLNGLPNID